MSGIWIVIVGFSVLSTLTVVGLFFWSAVSEGRERQALRDRLHERIHVAMQEMGLSLVVREAVDLGYLNRFLDHMLAL